MSETPLAIAFFAQDFPPHVGGTHVYNEELARRLHERGHRVCVFTWTAAEPGVAAADAAQPFRVHRQPFSRPGRGISPAGVAEALLRWRPDVAFVSGGSGALSRVVHAAAALVPTVVSVHDLRDMRHRRGRLGRSPGEDAHVVPALVQPARELVVVDVRAAHARREVLREEGDRQRRFRHRPRA